MARKPLGKEFTAKCSVCKHGKGAHKGGGFMTAAPCKMKHCKCGAFKG